MGPSILTESAGASHPARRHAEVAVRSAASPRRLLCGSLSAALPLDVQASSEEARP